MTEEALPEIGTIRKVTRGGMTGLMTAGTSLMAEDIKIAIARGKTTDKITVDWAVMAVWAVEEEEMMVTKAPSSLKAAEA